jgi:NCS1 family nucleobase:cation symporter-1
LAFIVAQFGISVAENALSNGIDLSALLPRYFNLRRGGYLTAGFAFIMQPWELMNGASNFLTVMGGYGVFLGSMTGVMFSDYYVVRERRLKLTGLYDASSTSNYWYWNGINWRTAVAWVASTWLLLPGFVRRVHDPTAVWNGWSHLYYMS